MTSKTYSIRTGCGTLRVTHVGRELLVHMSKGGSCPNAVCEAVVRSINVALRYGAAYEDLARALRGIECPNALWTEGQKVTSCMDAIGILLEEIRQDQEVAYAA